MQESGIKKAKKPFYKKWWFWVLAVFVLLIIVVSLGDDTPDETSDPASAQTSDKASEPDKQKTAFTQENIDILISNPKKYKGSGIEFIGRVFVEPERDEKGTYLQIFADPTNMTNTIIVGILDPNLDVKTDNYVKVTGTVIDEMKGTNAFGAELNAPVVEAEKIEIIDYITAVSPTIKTINVDNTVEQHGIKVTLEKIELAKEETRVYIKVKNDSEDNASIWTHTAKLVQGSKQYEEEYNFDADYPELQSELLPEIETEGVITFNAISQEEAIKFVIEGVSDDYSLDFEPFVFEIEQ